MTDLSPEQFNNYMLCLRLIDVWKVDLWCTLDTHRILRRYGLLAAARYLWQNRMTAKQVP